MKMSADCAGKLMGEMTYRMGYLGRRWVADLGPRAAAVVATGCSLGHIAVDRTEAGLGHACIRRAVAGLRIHLAGIRLVAAGCSLGHMKVLGERRSPEVGRMELDRIRLVARRTAPVAGSLDRSLPAGRAAGRHSRSHLDCRMGQTYRVC